MKTRRRHPAAGDEVERPVTLDFDGTVRRGEFTINAAFTCSPGEVLGILGPNGSGKSTLVSAVAGLERLATGHLQVDGVSWDDGAGRTMSPAARRVGLLTASGDLFPHLDARDNVAFGLRARGMSRAQANARARVELDRLDLAALAGRRPRELSSGQAQRVALARALALDPDVLVLDEPLSAIDQSGRDELRALLAERLEDTKAVTLLVTHDPLEALTLTDRLMFLGEGRVTQLATPADVVRHPRSTFAARVVGLNLWRGVSDGRALVTSGGAVIVPSEPVPAGEEAFAAFAPTAVSLWHSQPEGSPRNAWHVTVAQIEHAGTTARVHLTGTADLVADVTLEAVAALRLSRGTPVVVTVKATDVRVYR